MDIKGLRKLNLIGTILFCIIGMALVSAQYYQLSRVREIRLETEEMMEDNPDFDKNREAEYFLCLGFLIIWLLIILIFTMLLYNYTVRGLDRKNFKAAKRWTLIGIIVGFAGGIIPLIIFIISYVSFDDAIRTPAYGQLQYGYPQQPSQIRYCNNCRRQIPPDSRLCPYCGVQQYSIQALSKPTTPPPQAKKPVPEQKQDRKLPPPPPGWKGKKNKKQ